MILCDESITQKVSDGEIGVDPFPEPEQVQPASLDVRLGDEVFDPESQIRHEDNLNSVMVVPDKPLLATTMETVTLPNHIAAQLAGRSTVGRKGVQVHCTAGWIDPGFSGQITLELYNFGTQPVPFEVGERIAQLVFFPLDGVSRGYEGKYQDQEGATPAKSDARSG